MRSQGEGGSGRGRRRAALAALAVWGALGHAGTAADAGPPAADPLEARVRQYLALLASPPAPAAEYAAFLARDPVWPNRQGLRARLDRALLADPNDAEVLRLCAADPPAAADALARCAGVARAAGAAETAAPWAGAAWAAGIDAAPGEAGAAAAFEAAWTGAITPADRWARFRATAHGATIEAARLALPGLDPGRRALGAALLALLSDDAADPLATWRSVPAPLSLDPALVVGTARRLRQRAELDAANGFWSEAGDRAEAAADPAGRRALAAEREALARALLAAGRPDAALALLDRSPAPGAEPDARAATLFLAGWIALRRLDRPDLAEARFAAIPAATRSLISRGRAAFWLSRVDAARRDPAAEVAHEREAAGFPTTFYGQQALARLDAETPGPATRGADAGAAFLASLRAALAAAAPAPPDPAGRSAFDAGELARAAAILVGLDQPRRAPAFLALAAATAPWPEGPIDASALAASLDLPDAAVSLARHAGARGLALVATGWPRPASLDLGGPDAASLPPGLALGVIRQESGFDPEARSPHGALGLMQLMPATAAGLARGDPGYRGPASLTADPARNVALGRRYLAQLLARFGGSAPLAIAAYNAGPNRVAGWIAGGAPPSPDADDPYLVGDAMLDWIEQIPVEETRDYVERVLADTAIYAGAAHVEGAVPDAGGGGSP